VKHRLEAIAALLLIAASIVLAAVVAVQPFPRGRSVLACALLAVAAAWWALLRRGSARIIGAGASAALTVGAVLLVVLERRLLEDVLILAGISLSLAAARALYATHAKLPAAGRPVRPVVFYNPKSGDGNAERFDVAGEARARGIEPIELQRGDDLATIVREAIARGADALGIAGGDGSQAIVAAIAAEHGLPYVCIPAGTRNETSAVVLVSNGPHRLGRVLGSGTRPRLDTGQLGITVIGSHDRGGEAVKRIQEWTAPSFEVASDRVAAAGIDGEAVKLDPPLRFRTRPAALRVRIAPQHPGASPSARMPAGPWDGIRAVARAAAFGTG
jgi:hypothetical protein